MKLSSNVVGDSNDENSFPHKFLLTNAEAFASNSSANIKLSKTQLHKIGQSEGFLGRLFRPLLKTGFHLMKNVHKPLRLIPLGLTAAASATDAAVHKKIFVSGMTTLKISKEGMNDITKIVKSLVEPGLLIKGVCETIENEAK